MSSTGQTLVVIGAQRCGTSSIAALLAESDNVLLPRGAQAKETDYFLPPHFEAGRSGFAAKFPRVLPGTFRCDVSPHYAVEPRVAERIRGVDPGALILYIMREPVARAYSHYRHLIRLGLLDPSVHSFLRALEDFPLIREHSSYGRNIRPFLQHFPEEQVACVTLSSLTNSPLEYLNDWLLGNGYPTVELAQTNPGSRELPRLNEALAPRSKLMEVGKRQAMRLTRYGFGERVVGRLRKGRSGQVYSRLNRKRLQLREDWEPGEEEWRLVKESFRDDQLQLEALAGFKFW